MLTVIQLEESLLMRILFKQRTTAELTITTNMTTTSFILRT